MQILKNNKFNYANQTKKLVVKVVKKFQKVRKEHKYN